MTKLKVLDLFSGIGGMSLGLHLAGDFETVRFCEMKPHARAVLEKNFGSVPCDEDVTAMEFREGEADVITAGFPCQDLSNAGRGAGLSGERSGLYREVIRAVRVVRPKWALLENVAALLNKGMGTVLGDLAEIRYDAEWHCIPGSAVGAPHRRDRVWILADPNGLPEGRLPLGETEENAIACDSGEVLAYAERIGQSRSGQPKYASHKAPRLTRKAINAFYERFGHIWSTEPDVGRVADGVPSRLDRLTELGNAVIPQIPQMIGLAILEAERAAA